MTAELNNTISAPPVQDEMITTEQINPLFHVPRGWIRESLPKFALTVKNDFPLEDRFQEDLKQQQSIRWELKTGIKPEESHFSIIVPIHNEEKSLPSFLSSLQLSDIPPQTQLTVIFITNACTDSSKDILQSFLTSRTILSEEEKLNDVENPATQTMGVGKKGNHTYIHVDTTMRGKAYSQTVANQMAIARGDTIAISVDSDCVLEPDAILNMFSHVSKKCVIPRIIQYFGMEK